MCAIRCNTIFRDSIFGKIGMLCRRNFPLYLVLMGKKSEMTASFAFESDCFSSFTSPADSPGGRDILRGKKKIMKKIVYKNYFLVRYFIKNLIKKRFLSERLVQRFSVEIGKYFATNYLVSILIKWPILKLIGR